MKIFLLYAGEDFNYFCVPQFTEFLYSIEFISEVKYYNQPYIESEPTLSELKKMAEDSELMLLFCSERSSSSSFIHRFIDWVRKLRYSYIIIPIYEKIDDVINLLEIQKGIKFSQNFSDITDELKPTLEYLSKKNIEIEEKKPQYPETGYNKHIIHETVSKIINQMNLKSNSLDFGEGIAIDLEKKRLKPPEVYFNPEAGKIEVRTPNKTYSEEVNFLEDFATSEYNEYQVGLSAEDINSSTESASNLRSKQIQKELSRSLRIFRAGGTIRENVIESEGILENELEEHIDTRLDSIAETEGTHEEDTNWNVSYMLKVPIIGDENSDKTQIFNHVIDARFIHSSPDTIGVDFYVKYVGIGNNEAATISFWDISSSERFSFIRDSYFLGSSGAIALFNINNQNSYLYCRNLLREIFQSCGNIPFLIIAKTDGEIPLGYFEYYQERIAQDFENRNYIFVRTNSRGEGLSIEIFQQLIYLSLDLYSRCKFDPVKIIETLNDGLPPSRVLLGHPKFGNYLNFILDKIKNEDNPAIDRFMRWVNTQFSVNIGNFSILL